MLRGRLLTSRAKEEVQWALSHSDVEGNKIADTATEAATLLDPLRDPPCLLQIPNQTVHKKIAYFCTRVVSDLTKI